jgi:deoxyribonuclease-1
LLDWHRSDPPDGHERWRNDRIEVLQGNRNPYIDRPETLH